MMDAELHGILSINGVTDATMNVMVKEEITTTHVLGALEEQHLNLLLTKLPIGQHAVIKHVWKNQIPADKKRQSCAQNESDGIKPDAKRRRSENDAEGTQMAGPSWGQLWHEYKSKQRSQVEKLIVPKKGKEKKSAVYHIGGMVFSTKKGKGVKKKSIPPPCEMELPFMASFKDVLAARKRTFFEDDEEVDVKHLTLADSTGTRIKVENQKTWTIGEFYSRNGYKPSRFKLYIMYAPPPLDSDDESDDTVDSDVPVRTHSKSRPLPPPLVPSNPKHSSIVRTKAKVSHCTQCTRDFYTFIPDTSCVMPDGSILFYQEPQLLCPLCDDNEFGWWYNVQLFPEFKDRPLHPDSHSVK